ncbi:MAG: tRNA guanosine(34) transglycosylase Tgt [Balneolaceae bacterium]
MFTLQNTSSTTRARAGRILTDHGAIETPVFMPVGTLGSVKAISQDSLVHEMDAPIILGNTYHLYLRPGNQIMQDARGIHSFMGWNRPLLTDSGGYQIFSLASQRTLSEDGATFKSHLDGSKHLFTPENVVSTQRIIGSDIMMILDECPPWPCDPTYLEQSADLTWLWARRGRKEFLESEPKYGHTQAQFGIIQGGTSKEVRKRSAEQMVSLGFEGNAIGGLSVGEPTDLMYEMTEYTTQFLPEEKPRYLMGVGTPANLLQCIARGIDMFDCVMPTRNARNGMIFTPHGTVNIRNARWKNHHELFDPEFPSELCSRYFFSYIHHLFRSDEILGLVLASKHNLIFYIQLMKTARKKILDGTFDDWYEDQSRKLERRV